MTDVGVCHTAEKNDSDHGAFRDVFEELCVTVGTAVKLGGVPGTRGDSSNADFKSTGDSPDNDPAKGKSVLYLKINTKFQAAYGCPKEQC